MNPSFATAYVSIIHQVELIWPYLLNKREEFPTCVTNASHDEGTLVATCTTCSLLGKYCILVNVVEEIRSSCCCSCKACQKDTVVPTTGTGSNILARSGQRI